MTAEIITAWPTQPIPGVVNPSPLDSVGQSNQGDGGMAKLYKGTTLDLIGEYIAERRVSRRFAGSTARTAQHTLITFAKSCPKDPGKISRRHVIKWLEAQEGLATSTVAQRLGVVRAFTRWASSTGRIRKDPCHSVQSPKRPIRVPRALDADKIELLLSQAPDTRVRLAISLGVCEGLRLAEIASLTIEGIDWRNRTILIRGKGDKERRVHLTPTTAGAIQMYLASYPASVGPLIRSLDGTRAITSGHLGRIMTDHMRDVGVKGWSGDHVSPHALRHTFASDIADGGAVDLNQLAGLLGHASIQTTQVYLRGQDLARTREAVEARPYAGGQTVVPSV